MRPNCPCSLTGEHDQYFNKEVQLGKLAKVTALSLLVKKIHGDGVVSRLRSTGHEERRLGEHEVTG